MRFIIYGAGAIGGVIGARLFQSGHNVLLIARGAHYEKIAKEGLRLQSPDEDILLSIPVVSHPREIEFDKDDVVIMTMKSQHTLDALNSLRASAGGDIPVICCQNGVANERMALRRFANVYGMYVMMPASHFDPGIVISPAKHIAGILDAGRYPEGTDDTIAKVCEALELSNISSHPDAKVMGLKYTKLLSNLNNALQAACKLDKTASDVSKLLRDEALACYQAAGIECMDNKQYKARLGNIVEMAPVNGKTRSGGSSWQSIVRGQDNIETDFLNGEIVQLGRLHGVPTPANCVVQDLGNEMVRNKLAPESFTLDEVRERIATATM